MIDIHVIRKSNRHLYERELDEHHRLRCEIYIGEKRWRALKAVDGREYDQFDTDSTIYVLGLDEAGAVACGSRLHPSLGPTLLNEVFPQLASIRGIPRDIKKGEWTRLFVSPQHRSERVSAPMMGAIACGALMAAKAEGFSELTIVSESFWLARFAALGWAIRPLGLPLDHEEYNLIAFSFPVDEAMIESTRAHYGIELPRLRRRDLEAAAPPDLRMPGGER